MATWADKHRWQVTDTGVRTPEIFKVGLDPFFIYVTWWGLALQRPQSGIFVFTWPEQSNWVSRNGNWGYRKSEGLRLVEEDVEEYHLRILVYKDKLTLLCSAWLSGGLFVWNVRWRVSDNSIPLFQTEMVQGLVISPSLRSFTLG